MALATQCPHCKTTFRVASDQLKLRGGIVRCGTCQEIFDANAFRIDLDALAAQRAETSPAAAAVVPAQAGARFAEPPEPREPEMAEQVVEAAPEPAVEVAQQAPEPEATAPEGEEEPPVFTLDLHATLDPLGILPIPAAPDEEQPAQPEPQPESPSEEQPAVPGEEQAPEEPAEEHPEEQPVLPGEEQAPGEQPRSPGEEQPGSAAEEEPELQAQAQLEPEPAAHTEPPVETHEEHLDGIEPEPAAQPEPAPQAEESSEPIFSMGSALLNEPEPGARPQRAEPSLDLPVDEELVAAPAPVDHHGHDDALHAEAEALARAAQHTPLPVRESMDASFAATSATAYAKPPRSRLTGRRSKLTPTRIAPPKLRVPEIDEPDFVKRSRQREQSGKRTAILMAVGSVVLLLALAAQGVVSFRDVLAARFPAARPALASACSVLGCRIQLPAQIENLTIETGELQTLGGNTYQLGTLLRNRGSLVQAWPHIELALIDAGGRTVLRRVFAPAEYLPRDVAPAAGFQAKAEQPVKVYFQLDQLAPSDYKIAVFYP